MSTVAKRMARKQTRTTGVATGRTSLTLYILPWQARFCTWAKLLFKSHIHIHNCPRCTRVEKVAAGRTMLVIKIRRVCRLFYAAVRLAIVLVLS